MDGVNTRLSFQGLLEKSKNPLFSSTQAFCRVLNLVGSIIGGIKK